MCTRKISAKYVQKSANWKSLAKYESSFQLAEWCMALRQSISTPEILP